MSDSLLGRVVAAIGHQYDLESEIGRGGMSVVYRARDIRLNRQVAIKVLPPELAYDPAIRLRFTREAQTSAHLSHPHIVPIYDVGERDGLAFFVMGFVSGGNLGALLAREPRQPIEESRRILRQIADALAYAHIRGVIHRDIKPDNILLEGDTGRAMVTDFGIARAMEAGARLTATGIAVGTPTYMSPEQALGEREIDGRSDLYALGVLGYQMLTGRVPFSSGSTMSLLLKHVNERPRPIAELRPDAPRALREALERALMKDPEDRWPTAEIFREALEVDAVPARRVDREPVRYPSPSPEAGRRDRLAERVRGESRLARRDVELTETGAQPRGEIVLEPEHLKQLTPEQRQDLRLWHGRVHLLDRIKAARVYFWSSLVVLGAGVIGGIAGLADDAPPAILAPIPGIYMTMKMWRRGKSLRRSGLKLRRVLLMPRAKQVIPKPIVPRDKELEKLAPREVLESPEGAAIRRAAEDRAAILDILNKLSKEDRALLPDVEPTVNALVDRISSLAQMLNRLKPDLDSRELLTRQLDSAGLALGNLRLDMIRLRSSGISSALSDVSSATQEARALSREIGTLLQAAAEVRSL